MITADDASKLSDKHLADIYAVNTETAKVVIERAIEVAVNEGLKNTHVCFDDYHTTARHDSSSGSIHRSGIEEVGEYFAQEGKYWIRLAIGARFSVIVDWTGTNRATFEVKK